jgi:enhancing lycopene biosynthesis protein 2
MKIGILLAGCGVYDGAEIHEAVFTLLAVDENDAHAVFVAPDVEQHHVVNHATGEETDEKRNVFVESARIARGDIKKLADVTADDFDALVIPGGFGAAKNLNKWAFNGPDGDILPDVKRIILELVEAGKPVGAVCMGPTVVAKALEGSGREPVLTVGSVDKPSPYDIKEVSDGMAKLGAKPEMKSVEEVAVDERNKIVTGPCYMMEASVKQIRANAKMVVDNVVELAK